MPVAWLDLVYWTLHQN